MVRRVIVLLGALFFMAGLTWALPLHAAFSPDDGTAAGIKLKELADTDLGGIHTSAIPAASAGKLGSKSASEMDEKVLLNSSHNRLFSITDATYSNSATAATYDNTTPDGAIYIAPGTQTSGYITAEGESRWFLTNVDSPLKLTALMNPGAAVDYDLTLYKLDEATGILTRVSYSQKGNGQYEQLSHVADPGYYFVLVQSYVGSDTVNPFTLYVGLSDSYDANEPDDNPWFAKNQGSKTFSSSQNIDNFLDEDWTKISLPRNAPVRLLLNNPSAYGEYRLDLYDANLNSLGYLGQNSQGQVQLPAGDYYIRVWAPSSFDLTTPYTLSVSYQTADVTRVSISNIASDGGVQGFINYGYGDKWRIKNNITISGRAFDASGNPVANAPVTAALRVTINQQIFQASTTTDSLGYFSVSLNNLTSAAGNYSYYNNGLSIHYYDIIPIVFFSGDKQVSANIDSLYHFAYQIRA